MNKFQRQSIRFRLTVWYTAILATTFAIVGIGIWLALRQSVSSTIDKELRSHLAAVRTYVHREAPAGGLSSLIAELNEDSATPEAANLRIADAAGRWIYRSPGSETWSSAPPQISGLPWAGKTQAVSALGKDMRIISAPLKTGIVQIGIPLDAFEELQREFLWTAAIGAPVLLLLAALGGFWMSGRALRPVDRIAGAARRIGARNLVERLPASGTGDELDRLSSVLNEMLDRLESAFNKITRFTADASHELRTPVAIIRTTTEIVQSRKRTVEEHCQAWNTVQAQAERMSGLIQDLLVLARADGASEQRVFEPSNISEIVTAACAQIQVIAEPKGLSIRTQIAAECTVFGDAGALLRAVLILLDNAVKYTSAPGAIEVLVNITDRDLVAIEVRDTGIGISRADLPHIFERFYRATKDRSRDTGGAGLGLSIAQAIAARHKGFIAVESTVGAGSVFRMLLPGRQILNRFRSSSESENMLELETPQ